MRISRYIVIAIFQVISFTNIYSQNFSREAGLRAGISSGFTYRQYLNENLSYEGLMSFRQNGLQLALLRQIHEQSVNYYSENFYIIYGYGGHIGFSNSHYYKYFFNNEVYYPYPRFSPLVGVDGFASIEYRVDSFPVTVALDYKPFFELSTIQFFRIRLWDFGLSFKYRF